MPIHRVKASPGWPGTNTSALADAYKEEAGTEQRTASAKTGGGRGEGEEVSFACCAACSRELTAGNVPAHPAVAGWGRTSIVQGFTEVLDGHCAPSCQ